VAEKLAAARQQMQLGADLTTRPLTVKAYFERWMADQFKLHAKPRSIATYEQMLKYYIYPALGDIRLDKLTSQHIRTWRAEMSRSGYADATIELARTVLRQGLAQALSDGVVTRNVAALVKGGRRQGKTINVLTVDQARSFLSAARGERLEAALRLLLSLGLRRGEVCGLRDEDIDLARGILHINGTLQWIPGEGLDWGEPKTASGRRTIKLPETLLIILREHLERRNAERAAMGAAWVECPYLFVAAKSGGPLNPNQIYQAFLRVARRAALPADATPHTLRHSCASFLYAQGAAVKTISAILGHANTAITNDLYIHLFQETVDEAAATVEALLTADAGDLILELPPKLPAQS
jgi:integrase